MAPSLFLLPDIQGHPIQDKARYADAFLSKADTLYTKRQFAEAEEFYAGYLVLMAPAIGGSNGKSDEGSSPTYVKVLVHRARARETLGKLEGALQGGLSGLHSACHS
jgi:hypothetical protein